MRDRRRIGWLLVFAVGGSADPQWDEAQRVLTVFLPKAAVVEVRFACYLHKEDWAQMGVQKWFRGTSAQRAVLTKLVTSGGHWPATAAGW